MQAGVCGVIGKDLLEDKLGFAVGIDGILGMVFGDGDDLGFAVGGRGGRENELLDAVAEHHIEKIDAAGDVGDIERAGLADRFGHLGFAGKVHDGADAVAGEDVFELAAVAEVGLAKFGGGRNRTGHQNIQLRGSSRHPNPVCGRQGWTLETDKLVPFQLFEANTFLRREEGAGRPACRRQVWAARIWLNKLERH